MKVIAIDPSINFVGWAIAEDGHLLNSGLIKPYSGMAHTRPAKTKLRAEIKEALHLAKIHIDLTNILTSEEARNPYIQIAYVERPSKFVRQSKMTRKNKNVESVQKLAMAYGVILLTLNLRSIPTQSVSPKLARKERAVASALVRIERKIGKSGAKIIKLTTHEAEAIVWASFYSRVVRAISDIVRGVI